MTHEYKISGMTCSGCASTIQKVLAGVENVTDVKISLDQSTATITMLSHVPTEKLQQALASFPTYQLQEKKGNSHSTSHSFVKPQNSFWKDQKVWKRASVNTLNCLIGCSIGDFGMIVFLQAYFPATSMITQMVLATIA